MSRGNIAKKQGQIKLVYGEVGDEGFSLDRVVEELGVEFHAFATSAGVLVMRGLMEMEEMCLAGGEVPEGHISIVGVTILAP